MGVSFAVFPICFPAHATVQLSNGSIKQMRDLAIGDSVHTPNGSQQGEAVIAWLHRDTDVLCDFLEFTLATGTRVSFARPLYYAQGTQRSLW